MTLFLLIRHGSTDALGRTLSGRSPGVRLNDAGRREVAALVARLSESDVSALYCSPLERTRETAELLGERLGLTPRPCAGAGELDFGAWSGRSFAELDADPAWQRFNAFRSAALPPGGELMVQAQARLVAALVELHAEHPAQTVAVVSHADPIKAVLGYFLGVPLDFIQRFEIAPASLSAMTLSEQGARVLCVNDTGSVPGPRREAGCPAR